MGHGVTLSNDGDEVDLLVKSLHEFNIEGLERVAGGGDKVQAGVNTGIGDLAAVDPVLLLQVGIEAALNSLQDGLPAMIKKRKK